MVKRGVVVDTNVIVSGILGQSYSRKIIDAWLRSEIEVVISDELKQEVNEVFKRPYVTKGLRESSKGSLRRTLGTLFNNAIIVVPKRLNIIGFPDEDDNFLLEIAISANAIAIVTGDKALLKLKKVHKVELLSPMQFCNTFNIK